MLRILHTADWHIGQTLRGYSREREHRAALAQISRIVAEHEIDALIVAGDVFDSQNPSGEAQRLFYETVASLHRIRPLMQIVVVAGNHDSAGRLEAPRALFGAFGVQTVGTIGRKEGRIDLARHLIPLADASGEVAAQVLAVSYPTAACLPSLAQLAHEAGSPIVNAVRQLYEELFESVRPARQGLPLIATGHLHVAGGLESEGAERRILVGGQHAAPPDIFPDDIAYVALGHLHRAQAIGRDAIRYSGSLFPLSAAEQPYRHGVTKVTLNGGAPAIEPIAIDRPLAFHRVPETGETTLAELGDRLAALRVDADGPIEERPFAHVHLSRAELGADYRNEVERIADRLGLRVVDIRLPPLPSAPTAEPQAGPPTQLKDRNPEDLFRLAFERRLGVAPEPAHLDIFHRILAEL